ncbi:hypothetical protein CLV62_12520 [Dysgonomonas alginatilytica]|uniref:Chromosome segregation ATPase n=1 Tax=Dysgonomonas alginatilytica TaxID=1605892 RepID=A0A2V3PS52_9BACT|nr:hypothetical protein [Dysgonomonas alginatilytica]PXV61187.1 hypothetical protein CLV62_12520 [Dysgonomonas alginatilytica]
MANNVLINFTADTGGLDEANKKLEELKKREQELIDKVAQLRREQQAAQLNARNTQDQSRATQEYGRRIQEVRNQLTQTRRSITDLSQAQRELQNSIPTEAMNQSFRTMLRNIREQIAMMEVMGDTGSDEYQRLVEEAGRLADIQGDVNRQINNEASDTRIFDTILEGTQLASGGFSVLTGAMSIFGEENKDVQQLMLKMQSLIAINTGLQQIQNAVQKESNLMMAVAALQLRAKAIAESLATKNTILATIAQKAFNLVAMANPYVLLAVALLSVVGALYIFSRNTETASEKQKKLNDLQRESIEIKKEMADRIKENGEDSIRLLEREYELMKAGGASEAQLAQKRKQINDERVRVANSLRLHYGEEISSLENNKKKAEELEKQLKLINDESQKLRDQGKTVMKFKIDGKIQKFDIDEEKFQKFKENIQERLGNFRLKISNAQEAEKEDEEARHQRELDEIESNKRAAEAGKKSAVALAQYKVILTKKGTMEELNAQIAALEVKKNVDLQNADITKGERLLITKETELQIQQLRDEFTKKQLQDEVELINAGLSAAKEGSLEEYNLKVNQLEKQKEIELSERNLTINQIKAIEAKYRKEALKLDEDFTNKVAENTINGNISVINAKLAQTHSGSTEEYQLRLDLAEEKAKLELQDVENTIKNEEFKAARIKEINAELAKEKKEILTEQDSTNLQKQVNTETLIATQQYENGKLSRRAYESELNKITIDSLNKQISTRRKNGEDTIDLEQELSEKRIQIAEQEAESRAAIQDELFNTISTLATLSFDNQKAQIQQQLSDLDHYYTTDAEKAKSNSSLKLISEEEYNRRQLELKRKAAQAEKNQAIFNLILTNGQAIARAFKDFPFPYSAIVAALVGVQTFAQLNAIRSQPLPRYWKGRKGGEGEHALVGEYGPEIMWIPKGASIMPAHDSIRAMNGDRSVMSKWNMPAIDPSYPVSPVISQQLISDARRTYNTEIDYDRVGRSVAKYQKTPVQRPVYVSVDRSGTTVTDGNTKVKHLNSKFKTTM